MCYFTEYNAWKITKKLWDWIWWWILVSKWKRNTKNKKKTDIVTVSKAVSRNKWKESNSELSEDEREQTRGNNCVKGSADLQQAIYNAKRDHTKMNLIDNGYEGKCLNWFTVSSASGRGTKYKLEIAESVKCTCKFLNEIDTPCKHIIYIYLYIFNIPESLYIIQPLHLAKTELKKLSPSLFEYIVSELNSLNNNSFTEIDI